MLVRMTQRISGTRNGKNWPPIGGVIELPESEALALAAHGYAVPLPAVEPIERATQEDLTEKAIIKTAVKRKAIRNSGRK